MQILYERKLKLLRKRLQLLLRNYSCISILNLSHFWPLAFPHRLQSPALSQVLSIQNQVTSWVPSKDRTAVVYDLFSLLSPLLPCPMISEIQTSEWKKQTTDVLSDTANGENHSSLSKTGTNEVTL